MVLSMFSNDSFVSFTVLEEPVRFMWKLRSDLPFTLMFSLYVRYNRKNDYRNRKGRIPDEHFT